MTTHPLEHLTALLTAVETMRTLQKGYFTARKKGLVGEANTLLTQSKAAEKDVDALLTTIRAEISPSGAGAQTSLF